ncbi:MAG: hypothetical protein Q7U53_01355 [Anaerolineaceae bacterium]|nr:hypothetical protein [Anaerolineaceae bacterium]
MSENLAALTARLRVLLNDPDSMIWTEFLLTECLQLGLAEIQAHCPYSLSIAGLDDAVESNLDQEMRLSPLLLQLAQQHALQQRQVQRGETFHPDPQKNTTLQNQALLAQALKDQLEQVRRYFLQRSPSAPF